MGDRDYPLSNHGDYKTVISYCDVGRTTVPLKNKSFAKKLAYQRLNVLLSGSRERNRGGGRSWLRCGGWYAPQRLTADDDGQNANTISSCIRRRDGRGSPEGARLTIEGRNRRN